MSTIPASQLVSVTPSVLGVGGSAVDIIGLVLTSGTRVPLGTVASFASAAAVAAYFGSGSAEAKVAGGGTNLGSGYFGGFNNSNKKPASILFAQYNTAAAAAWLRGGNISALTLTQLQAITGSLSITVDGHVFPSAAVNLSAAVSFSSAATIIQTAINAVNPGGGAVSPTVTYDSVSGGFLITSGTTGATSTIGFATGSVSATLLLTSATGAVNSQGAAIAVPGTFMDALVRTNKTWATFMTAFDPDGGSGNTNKQAFAAWNNAQGQQFAYICWDTDITPTQSVPASSSLGQILAGNSNSGTCLIYEATDLNIESFILGAAASIDFTQTNGRITFAYKSQDGLVPSVTDATVATNLGGNPQTSDRGNYYNFYGAYAAATPQFQLFQRGFVTGSYSWLDSYINQIWLNRMFQGALLSFLASVNSVPYTTAGNAMIEQALADSIAAGLNFGAYAPGTISSSQIAAVNAAAGLNIANTLQTQGYYLQVLPASSSSRAARTTPPCTFWYLDRGSVQSINLASVALQ